MFQIAPQYEGERAHRGGERRGGDEHQPLGVAAVGLGAVEDVIGGQGDDPGEDDTEQDGAGHRPAVLYGV